MNPFLFAVAAIMVCAALVGLVLLAIELRRITRRPNPFGGYSMPRSLVNGDGRCPNCAQSINDDDAVRCRDGITWHERCARQMVSVGKWGGP